MRSIEQLAKNFQLPVHRVDERLSSVAAREVFSRSRSLRVRIQQVEWMQQPLVLFLETF